MACTDRIAVGMSGGIDSTAAAAFLVEQGADVIGLTAHLWTEGSRCCSLEDIERARAAAAFLNIPHYVVNLTEAFQARVVNPFVASYARGETPSPCILCNTEIKFGLLLAHARALDCARFASGHYARTAFCDDRWHLFQGTDAGKDQSYFLHRLTQDQLARTVFPLGDRLKTEVVRYAAARGLPAPRGGESQDLCFVADRHYADFVEARRPELKQPGPIVDPTGRVLGAHQGFYRYTIGQREGLGIAVGQRAYVTALDAATRTVTVGARTHALRADCRVMQLHWIGPPPEEGAICRARLRYRHAGTDAVLHYLTPDTARVVFAQPQFAVAPGQAAVFYRDDEVLGGGWIC